MAIGTGKAKSKKEVAVITAAEILEYVEVTAINNSSEKKRKRLRDAMVARLEAGITCEASSPYRLEIRPVDKSAVVWKEEYAKLLREWDPEGWQARMDKLEEEQRKVELQLVVVANIPASLTLVVGR